MTAQPMTAQPMTAQPMTAQPMTGKKTVAQLAALGFSLRAYSSGGDFLVQSFLADYRGKRRLHAWFDHRLGAYVFD